MATHLIVEFHPSRLRAKMKILELQQELYESSCCANSDTKEVV
jgi:hypothetical protein